MNTRFILCLAAVFISNLRVDAAGEVDLLYNPNASFTAINSAIQADGKLLIGAPTGGTIGGSPVNGLARLATNGTLDPSFSAAAIGGNVHCLAVLPDGGSIVAGTFLYDDGSTIRYDVARLNADGSLNPALLSDLATDSAVIHALAIQADGKILIAGPITGTTPIKSTGGTTRAYLARLNANGTLDTSFNPAPNNTVRSIALQPDGKILIGGSFTTVGFTPRNRVARLNPDGSVDTSFTADASGTVSVLVAQPDGRVLLGGSFGAVNSTSRQRLARVNYDGTLDTAFQDPAITASGGPTMRSICLQANSSMVIVGLFDSVGGSPRKGIARLNADGTLDSAFNPDPNTYPDHAVLQPDGAVVVVGDFNTVGGTSRNRIARLINGGWGEWLIPINPSEVRWWRNGTTPETASATFELSTDGGNTWSFLGNPIHATTVWDLTGLSLPASGRLRARARTFGGKDNSSSGMVQTLADFVSAPTVTLNPPSSLLSTTITLNGTVNPNGSATTAQFEYGTTTSYGSTAAVTLSPNNGSNAQNVSANLTGLIPGTLYHYRLSATNSAGTSSTSDATFTTLSNNANLSALSLSTGTLSPAFAPGTTTYAAAVSFSTTGITVTPTREQANATITVNGNAVTSGTPSAPISLNLGSNAITIVVTAQDGTTKTYTVTVTRSATPGPGELDFSFDSDGIVTTAVDAGEDRAYGVAIQGDGKIVAVGNAKVGSTNSFALVRYLADGSLDLTFGTGGKVTTSFAGADAYAQDVAIQSDGKIVVAGHRITTVEGNSDIAVARYTTAGALDTSFGSGGIFTVAFSTNNEYAFGVAVQIDGKIVVAGNAVIGGVAKFALLRLTSTGNLDSSFDGDGLVTTSVGGIDDAAQSIVIQPDGKIIIAGYANAGTHYDFGVARYTSTGALDASLDGDGILMTDISGSSGDFAYNVALQPDGKILVAGSSFTGGQGNSVVVRYQANGAIDTNFNGTGKAVVALAASANDEAYGLAVQRDGKIVVGGYANSAPRNFAVMRLTSAGALDTTFNGTGKVITPIGSGNAVAHALGVQADGGIVLAGYSNNGTNDDFTLVRYLGGPDLPSATTLAATDVLSFSATLNGTGNPNGLATTAWFEYGPTTSYGTSTTAQNIGSGMTNVPMTANLTGLADNTLYHCRLVAQNADGTVYGNDITFTTPQAVPEIRLFAGADDTGPELTDGQVTAVDFGSTLLGTPVTRSFTVKNAGTADLHVSGITLPAVYEYVGPPFHWTLVPNSSITFQVRFLANTVHGTFGGNMSLANDDADEGAFDVPVTAAATGTVMGGGALDTSFGSSGKVTTDIGSGNDVGRSVAVQSDGKILVAGLSDNSGNDDIALVRYTSTGALDTSFNGTGKVATDFGYGDAGRSVAVQSDGKILVAGYSSNGSNWDFALVRYTSTGALDTSFNGTGKVTTPIGSSDDFGYSVAVQSDGKILVAGYSSNGSNWDFALVRYTSTGALDTSFNGTGKAAAPIGSSDDVGQSVAVQSDGKILVAGYSSNGSNWDFAVVRYTSMGALDTSFNGTGKVATDFGYGDAGRSVAVQSDGKILVAGYSYNGSTDRFALVRYTSTGALDTSFNGTGKVTTPIDSNGDRGSSVAVQSDGKILVAGYSHNGSNWDFALVRYTSTGALDTSFNGTGKVTTAIGSNDVGQSVAVQGDGKIVVAGYSNNGINNNDFALVRYDGDTVTYTAPTGATSAASSITPAAATLNGTVNPNGVITNAWFEYGTTTSYGQTTAGSGVGYGTSAVNVAANLASLTPGTLYHYRLVAQNGETTAYGADMTFTTAMTPQQAWRQTYFGTTTNTGNAADTANPDGDAHNNFSEFVWGLNPTVSDGGEIVVSGGVIVQRGTPAVNVENIPGGVDFRALFGRRKDHVAAGLTYTVQFSPDLTDWQNSTATPTVIADDGTIEACTVPYPFFINGKKARFFRVNVTGL